jgi:hypothetical protein
MDYASLVKYKIQNQIKVCAVKKELFLEVLHAWSLKLLINLIIPKSV